MSSDISFWFTEEMSVLNAKKQNFDNKLQIPEIQ